MRFYAFLIFLLFSLDAFTQDSFSIQLNTVVKDTTTGFKEIRGDFDKKKSVYRPRFQIDSTIDGKVYDVRTRSYCTAEIEGSSSKDSIVTASLLPHWKQKIANALGPAFKIEKAKAPAGFKAYFGGGYIFSHGRLFITLEHWKGFPNDETIHFLRIFIMYKPGI